MGLLFGFDIGIASVGWAVVDENYEVIESGSNLFSSADASSNIDRRMFRQSRRGKRRERTRITDFVKLWENSGLLVPNKKCNYPLELRVKGIHEKLELEELYFVLYSMLKHRGISYLEDAMEDSEQAKSTYAQGLFQNNKELETMLPCEIQYSRLTTYGHYRGDRTIILENGEKRTLCNIFTTGAYKKEMEVLLKMQRQFHSFITDEFVQDYISIFSRKREYYEGPGNELSRTDYGKYTTKIDVSTGQFITEDNIFEKLIGKCSVYPDQRRAAAASYTAQEFNVLNDLNTIVVNERKLSKEEKEKIVLTIKTANSINMRKIISKVIEEEIVSLSGARIDKSEKEIFHSFEQYNKMRKELDKINFSIEELSVDELDEIGEILTLNTDKESIEKAFRRYGIDHGNDFLECMIALRKKNGSLFNKWHSFSLMIMQQLIPEMYEIPKNQMQLLTDMGIFKTNTEKFKSYNKIPGDIITEDIYNPVVRRSIQITVKVLNALIKKYSYPEQIVIEMPRDKNLEEQKKRIKDAQKNNEKELKDILAKIKSEYGITINDEDFRSHKKLGLKLKLWNEQNGICLYSGKSIAVTDILNNPFLFEIDHVIPLSISFDDSRTNKVLVYRTENQDKGARTPYMYLSNLSREWDYHQYMSYVLELKAKKKIVKPKVDKLLFMEDITKIDVLKGFISRNINDTRYASKVVLNSLQSYLKVKEANTKVKVVRGSFTNQMRFNMKLEKDREESFLHHAVDAMLVCFSQLGYDSYRKVQENFIDFEHNEITDVSLWNEKMDERLYEELLYQNKWASIRKNIKLGEEDVKYWHRVDRKCNRSLCNQTIRGTRVLDGKVKKINKLNIYTDTGFATFKKMIEGSKQEKFLMYRHDPKTFNELMKIYNVYKDAKNPFVQYEKETGDFVRKYAKNRNGARIINLKYEDGEVNSCIDISHKYGHEANSKKIILESLKPFRMDVYYNSFSKLYYLVGLKYSDIKCQGNLYMIDENAYRRVLLDEGMIEDNQSRNDLQELGYEFCMSFYKDEIIQYERAGKVYTERFLSRTMPKVRNYIETKPIHASKFDKQNLVGLSKTTVIKKINLDILGNQYVCSKEKFKMIVDKI